ncbi:MAG TPA: M56 family metallopeptidase [Bryobacteraceae bacterium]
MIAELFSNSPQNGAWVAAMRELFLSGIGGLDRPFAGWLFSNSPQNGAWVAATRKLFLSGIGGGDRPFAGWLLNHLWQSTLFACVVGLLALMLRRNRAAVRHGLWLAASMKFLAPLALLVAAGNSISWRRAPAEVPFRLAAVEQIGEPFVLPESPPLVASTPKPPSRLPAILIGIWLCGFAANLLAWWRRWRRVRAALRAASPLALDLPVPVMSSPARLEPGVFGVFRPVLLLPEGIAQRLTPAQFQAVIAHELCHARRRDNLAAAIHMVVEALFWFHPLVWWIERRLVEERERACDEEVLRMAADPQDYAEGIVKVCKFYLESPLVCVSGVTGADLKRRVEAIMLNRAASELTFARKLLLTGAGVFAIAGPLAIGVLNAPRLRGQSKTQPQAAAVPAVPASPLMAQVAAPTRQAAPAPAPLAFDTAPVFQSVSIKAVDPASRFPGISPHLTDPQWFEFKGWVSELIQWAYGVPRDFQIAGEPDWFGVRNFQNGEWGRGGEGFEIHATAARPSSEAEMKQMVQALLADRFKLRLHRETRQIPIYAIVIGPGGPHLPPETEPVPCPLPYMECGFPSIGGDEGGVHVVKARYATMGNFSGLLTNNMDRPVIDKTGLTAGYSFDLVYEHSGPGWWMGPSAAIQAVQTLGLRLEPQMEPMEMLVIDSVDRP